MAAKKGAKPKVGANRGNAGKGRPKGSANKTTTLLKDAILLAADQVGADGAGKGGLVGYLNTLARSEPKAYSSLLGRVLPTQLTGPNGGPIESVTRIEQVIVDGKR